MHQHQPVDLLIIGGGIVGAGVARDAVMRGLSTLLVEQYDFAFGTSSRSSRLLHGGIRYLAQGRVGLVREASREKKIIGRIAPHLVQPLAFIYPAYRNSGQPLWKLSIGVKIYDALCKGRNFGPSQTLGREETRERVPGLNPDALAGSVRYYDALTNDARLVIDTLRAAHSNGAHLRNYTRFIDATFDHGQWICRLNDSEQDRDETIRARSVVNATGPWSDRVPHSHTRLRLTKGVHLVVDSQRLPVSDAVVMASGSRILFAVPWGERTYLGTTDTDFDGTIERPDCTESDINYILRTVNRAFPFASLEPKDIRGRWSGLRPLVGNGKGDPSDVSRSHEIKMGESGWWDITGGKLTTYRLMAEQAVDNVVDYLQHIGQNCRTAEIPICDGLPIDGVSAVIPPAVTRDAVEHYCLREWARHLDDIMIRRSSWVYAADDPAAITNQVAQWMASILGWDAQRADAEKHRLQELS